MSTISLLIRVYSFGVVLIELISSKPDVDIGRRRSEINLATMAVNRIQDDGLRDLVDPGVGFGSDERVIVKQLVGWIFMHVQLIKSSMVLNLASISMTFHV